VDMQTNEWAWTSPPGDIGISHGNNHVPKEKEFKLSHGATLNLFFLWEQSCPPGRSSTSPWGTWALPQEKFIAPWGSCIFHHEIFLTPWGTCLELALF
jgi:hypothetical protein